VNDAHDRDASPGRSFDDMTVTIEEARVTAQAAAAPGPADRLMERLAELVGAKATVQAVYGQPIQRGDVTVVPVARVRWGFGGGGGSSEAAPTAPASGSGGGGGVVADPVGYLEIGPMGATFKPIRGLRPSPLLVLAAGISAGIILRSVARLMGR
jgi:Sporulation protein YtfJ (Spore_YtfJ)